MGFVAFNGPRHRESHHCVSRGSACYGSHEYSLRESQSLRPSLVGIEPVSVTKSAKYFSMGRQEYIINMIIPPSQSKSFPGTVHSFILLELLLKRSGKGH